MINRKTLVIFIIIGVPIDLLSDLSIGIVTDSEKFPAARPNTCHWRPYSFKDFLAFSYQIHQHRDSWWKYFQFLDFRECATRQNVFFLPIFFRIMISVLVVYLMMHVLLYFWYNFGTMLVTSVNNIYATMTQVMTKNSQEPGKQSHHGGKSRHFNGKSDCECMYSM